MHGMHWWRKALVMIMLWI